MPPRLLPSVGLASDEPEITPLDDAFVSRREVVKVRDGVALPVAERVESGGIYDNQGRLRFDPRDDRLHGAQAHRFHNPLQIDPRRVETAVRVDRECVYLGTLHGHFGHFLLESLSRAWALEQVPADTPVVFHYPIGSGPTAFADPRRLGSPAFILTVLDALGIDATRLVLANKDLCIRRLLVPAPLLVLGRSAHERLASTYDRIGAAIDTGRTDWPQDIYLTRRKLGGASVKAKRKSVANEEEIEPLFTSRGFEVVAPETLSFADQIGLMRHARRIAGTSGSALHMCMFAHRPDAHLIAVDWRVIEAQCFCDAARGLRADHIYAPAGAAPDGTPLIDISLLRETLEEILPSADHRSATSRPPKRASKMPSDAPVGNPPVAKKTRRDKTASERRATETTPTGLAKPDAAPPPNASAAKPAKANAYLKPRLPTHPNGTASAQRLARIATATQARAYLEIGVLRGTTFNSLGFERKVAVDPDFKFETADFVERGVAFVPTTSDAFFQTAAEAAFDLIFIDGLHVFQQAMRDFCASLAMSHPRTVWLIDDVMPSDVFSAMTDRQMLASLRESAKATGTAWHGDVYKVVFAIHDFFPSFRFCTLSGGNAQTLVWRAPRKTFAPRFNSLETIERLTYFELQKSLDVLNIVPEAEGIEMMRLDLA